MAGDWIKMRTDLYRDPKVCLMADALLSKDSELSRYVSQNMQRDMTVTRNVMRNVTVGALVSVWGVLRHRGKRHDTDLAVKGCAISVIDDLADLPGFGSAMASVGWVEESADGLVFPRFFEEFNVDPSEEMKQKNAERQRRYREKQKEKSDVTRDVTVASQSNAREEKRREEKKKTPMSGKPDDSPPDPDSPAGLLAYLNTKSGRRYRPVEANLSLVRARLKTATPDDIRAVIDAQCAKWAADPKMAEYLRPETLFGATKFESYIGGLGAAMILDPIADAIRERTGANVEKLPDGTYRSAGRTFNRDGSGRVALC